MVLSDDDVPQRSKQRIGAITRYELYEKAFKDTEGVWGSIISSLLLPTTDITQLPIYVPEVLQHMVIDVHLMLTNATGALRASMAETVRHKGPEAASANQTMSQQINRESGRLTMSAKKVDSGLEVLDKASEEYDEHLRSVSLYDQCQADLATMESELKPLLDHIKNSSSSNEDEDDEWYNIMHPDEERAHDAFARYFLPVSQVQLGKWAQWVCLKKRWLEYIVLTHNCGRSFLRVLNTQYLMFD